MDQKDASSEPRGQKAGIRLDLNGPGEHIKHRRTRSGCFTCRARRVKCDEARPICERCAKGGRQCTFPEATVTSKGQRTRKRQSNAVVNPAPIPEESPSPEDFESDAGFSDIHPIDPRFLSTHALSTPNPSHSAPGSVHSQRSMSPSGMPFNGDYFDSRNPIYIHASRSDSVLQDPSWISGSIQSLRLESHPDPEINFWLNYHRQNITFHHYLLKSDLSDFFTSSLLSFTSQSDALLYSVVAFSAFHYFVNDPTASERDSSSVETFFEYHNRAIASLRASFQESLVPDILTLLTVLQLATLEEYLGDWANLIHHRKGAHMILQSLFSPQSILDTPEGSLIFSWFTRIDLSVSIIAGLRTILDAEWYDAAYKSCRAQLDQQPDNYYWIAMCAESHSRYISMQSANLLSDRFSGLCDYETYENAMIGTLNEISLFWEQFAPESINASTETGAEKALLDYTYAEVHAMGLLLHHQRSLIHGYDQDYMTGHCMAICELVATATKGTQYRPSSLLPFQLALPMAAAFNPDEGLKEFLRTQFYKMEQLGFIYPIPFRTHLSKLWNEPSIRFEWIPENQTFPPVSVQSSNILSAIRVLAEDRNEEVSRSSDLSSTQLMRNLFSFADLQS
ncbi:hypothetical protein ABW19_dt0207723 [Dactylella cylindrospora]|nr:hypothetical protein ABW19_dt0207723 [Dactylella cylindrospora]